MSKRKQQIKVVIGGEFMEQGTSARAAAAYLLQAVLLAAEHVCCLVLNHLEGLSEVTCALEAC